MVMCDVPLVKYMLTVPNYFLVLHAFRNGFQEDVLHNLSRDCSLFKAHDKYISRAIVLKINVWYLENLGPIIVLTYIILPVVN